MNFSQDKDKNLLFFSQNYYLCKIIIKILFAMLKLNRIHHVAIICSDYRRSLDFYTRILGLTVIAEHYRAERDSYKCDLALGGDYIIELFSYSSLQPCIENPETETTGLTHLAFEIDDMTSAMAELDRQRIPHEEIRIDKYTGKHFVFFHAPDGMPVELYEK